jgi:multidrug transporter EmrE-like cation transporter
MNLRQLLLILGSVGLSALAQVLFKSGMARLPPASSTLGLVSQLITSPAVVGGFVAYGVSACAWLFVLQKTDLSVAYPFVSLGFVLTMLAGWYLFAEPVGILRIVGTLLICAGVLVVAASARGT